MKRFPLSLGAPRRRPIIRPKRFPSPRVRAPPDYDNRRPTRPLNADRPSSFSMADQAEFGRK